ncbi:metallophosphoesterase [Seohaeicola saemankumensis]|nr:metallophosphoesterase [Seohaeicola saemankumensis]MCA0873701.1 metallophosphoesterase [Seohaeicola saemankumensis]
MLRAVLLLLCLASGVAAEPLRIAVISDLNGSYGTTKYGQTVHAAIERVIDLRPDLVISTGDMVAGQQVNPHLSDKQVKAMWSAFDAAVTTPLAQAGIPFVVTPGNHDASAYGGFEREREIYARVWGDRTPDLPFVDRSEFPFRYALSAKGVLLVSLDVTTVGALSGAQFAWLDDLLTREAPGHRAIVLFSHLPLWPFAEKRRNDVIGDQKLHDLLVRHGVDLYLTGHHHAYYPGVADGILMISQSCLGSGPRVLLGATHRSPKAFTLIEIAGDGTIDEQALQAPDFVTRIKLRDLPESIGRLVRRDLAKK